MLGVGAWISVAATGRLPSHDPVRCLISRSAFSAAHFPLLPTVFPLLGEVPCFFASRRADDSGQGERRGFLAPLRRGWWGVGGYPSILDGGGGGGAFPRWEGVVFWVGGAHGRVRRRHGHSDPGARADRRGLRWHAPERQRRPPRCPRPDVIEQIHRLVPRGRRRRDRDEQLPGDAAPRWTSGARRSGPRDQPRRRGARPPRGRRVRDRRIGGASWPARSARPGCCPPATTRSCRRSRSTSWPSVFARAGRGLLRRRGRSASDRDVAGHPRGEGGHHGRPGGVHASRPRGPAAGAGHARRDRPDAARHRHRGRRWRPSRRMPVDVIGLNCSTGPEHMREPVRYLGEHSSPAGLGDARTPACR